MQRSAPRQACNPTTEGNSVFVTPAMFDTRQEIYEPEQVFGGVTQAMTLEDSVWDISLVSKPTKTNAN